MRPETGRVIRRVAYCLEVVSMLGLISVARDRGAARSFAGIGLRHWFSGGLAVGITLWVVGTVVLYWPRKKPDQGRGEP